MKILLSVLLCLSMFGCTTHSDGSKQPNLLLIQNAATASAYVVVTELDKGGLNPNEVLMHIYNLSEIADSFGSEDPVNFTVLQDYVALAVPTKYQAVSTLVLLLVKQQLDPLVENEKIKQGKAITKAVLNGVKIAIQMHYSTQPRGVQRYVKNE